MRHSRKWTKGAILTVVCAGCSGHESGRDVDASSSGPEGSSTVTVEGGAEPTDASVGDALFDDAGATQTSVTSAVDADGIEAGADSGMSLSSEPDADGVSQVVDSGGTSSETSSSLSSVSTDAGSSDSAETGTTSSDSSCDGGVCPSLDTDDPAADSGATDSCPPSCVKSLFTSCVPDGHDACLNYGYGETVCWPNGAYQQLIGGLDTSSATVYHANGDVCLSMTNVRNPDNTFDMQWFDAQGTLAALGLRHEDGSYTISCIEEPNGYVIDATTNCFPFALPFLDAFRCEYGIDEPSAGTCGY